MLALGKTWRLHKVYLCQSSYFASMFGGSWRETNQDFVNIEIIDPKINIEGMFWTLRSGGVVDGGTANIFTNKNELSLVQGQKQTSHLTFKKGFFALAFIVSVKNHRR